MFSTHIYVYVCELRLYVDILRGMISAEAGLMFVFCVRVCMCICVCVGVCVCVCVRAYVYACVY